MGEGILGGRGRGEERMEWWKGKGAASLRWWVVRAGIGIEVGVCVDVMFELKVDKFPEPQEAEADLRFGLMVG